MQSYSSSFLQELAWRDMIHDVTPGTDQALAEGSCSAYIGFDPTAPSLHIGNLATVMLLVHLQRHGHRPIALVGGATGMIGDPSGKKAERQLLDADTIATNIAGQKAQLQGLLDFDHADHPAELVNNFDWFKDISFIEFLRDTGKHLTINYMMGKDSVKSRLETGLSFTEFSYMLLQGYDFYHLYEHHGVKLQMGGSDQWGNITAGTEFIRRKAGGEAYALTAPLLTKADGSKFGKSEGGNIWLDPQLTSPYAFYQFWLNTADEEVETLLKRFTLMSKDQVQAVMTEHAETPHLRTAQKALAEAVTVLVHGQQEYEQAEKASHILFDKKATAADLASLNESTFVAVFEGVPQAQLSHEQLQQAEDWPELLGPATQGTVFASKGEARKMIQGGGVSVNKEKLTDATAKPGPELIHGKYLVVQRGKKNYYLLSVGN